MTDEKRAALAAIEDKADLVSQVADSIWSFAELSLQEEKSAALYCDVLEKEGFTVERGICNIPTAFSASYGSGRPVIGFLAEYDALSGLSQEGGSLTRHQRVDGGNGHGCGHNLLGAGAFAAALGVKTFLEATKTPGTVVLYGCPGEEGGAAKAFMARDGLWYGLDAALTWHPNDANEVLTGSSNSCIQTQYHFTGVAAHAAGDPDRGRSALDAVELMNVGVQYPAGTHERQGPHPLRHHRRRRPQPQCGPAPCQRTVHGPLQPCGRGRGAAEAGGQDRRGRGADDRDLL